MMMYGSHVFLVVLTVMEPSTRFRSAASSCLVACQILSCFFCGISVQPRGSASTFRTSGQTCLSSSEKHVPRKLYKILGCSLGASGTAPCTVETAWQRSSPREASHQKAHPPSRWTSRALEHRYMIYGHMWTHVDKWPPHAGQAKAHRLPVVDPLVIPRLVFPIFSFLVPRLRLRRASTVHKTMALSSLLCTARHCFRGSLLLGLALNLRGRP